MSDRPPMSAENPADTEWTPGQKRAELHHAEADYRRTHSRDGYALGSAHYPNNREGRRALARTWKRVPNGQ